MAGRQLAVRLLVYAIAACYSPLAFGQIESIHPQPGKQLILKGQVRAGQGRERLYIFEAKPKQRLTVHLDSADSNAVFSVNEQYRVDRQAFAEDKTEWTGALPESESHGLYSISVTAARGTATYTLEITLEATSSEQSPARSAGPGVDRPKNVREYYLLMPPEYDGNSCSDREETLESSETFVDLKNGYIGSQIGKLGERCQVAIFKRPDGGFILAYNEDGDPAVNVATKLFLLSYDEGQWTDVTSQLLPVPVNKKAWYDLPNIGTTIKVTTAKGIRLYSLVWRNGRFEKQ